MTPDELKLVSDLCVAHGFTIEKHTRNGSAETEFLMWSGGRSYALTTWHLGRPAALLHCITTDAAVYNSRDDLRSAINDVLTRTP